MTLQALALVLVLATEAADGGVEDGGALSQASEDAGVELPRIFHLTTGPYTGDYLFTEPAFRAVDSEMKRLQDAEQSAAKNEALRKAEPAWYQIVLVSTLVGIAIGAAGGFYLGRLSVPAK